MKQHPVSTKIVNFFSRLNNRELPYCAILPANYEDRPDEKFPVLYLLHGLFGRFDNWLTNTDLIEYAGQFSFIIICAEGGDSWYTDSTEIKNHLFESYIIEELIPEVENKFKVRGERNSRAIAGLSMGGYGAFKLAFRRPDLFSLAASMSGAFHAAAIFENQNSVEWNELKPSILNVFGKEEGKIRQANDLFHLANNFPAENIHLLPYFYLDCGSEDSFLPLNIKFAELLQKRKMTFEFHEPCGGHDWEYWNRQLPSILQIVADNFILNNSKDIPAENK
ncbi:MAG: esterase family protein [Acidobacteriota bacterium]|nr:esterase family protein [Acidobacteriota bacterium]